MPALSAYQSLCKEAGSLFSAAHWLSKVLLMRKEKAHFFHKRSCSFFPTKDGLVLLLYVTSILSSEVTHTGRLRKYTHLVLLTHYSPLGDDCHVSGAHV